jgi:hypothetical protein
MLIVCWVAIVFSIATILYVIVTASSSWRRRTLIGRDPLAPYVNSAGQAVAQMSPADLPRWLEDHKSFEIVSLANVGPFVVVVYK